MGKEDEQHGQGRRAESKRRKNDRDDHGRKVSSDDRRRRPWNLERDRVRDYERKSRDRERFKIKGESANDVDSELKILRA
ncbi:hypothetical protein Tco_0866184 [Tanacetum coccineum]